MYTFSTLWYVNPNNISEQYPTYVPGTIGVYGKDIKYPSNGDGPVSLVYASHSFVEQKIDFLLPKNILKKRRNNLENLICHLI